MSFIVNIVIGSSKQNDELQAKQVVEITHLIENNEFDTGTEANQLRTLQWPRDTRWGSHFNSICSLFKMFSTTCLFFRV